MTITKGTQPKSLVRVCDISQNQDFSKKLEFKPIIDEWKANFDFLHNVGSKFYYLTNHDAPNNRIISLDINYPQEENWREILRGEDENGIESAFF
jgi:prolyl oligopeptidase